MWMIVPQILVKMVQPALILWCLSPVFVQVVIKENSVRSILVLVQTMEPVELIKQLKLDCWSIFTTIRFLDQFHCNQNKNKNKNQNQKPKKTGCSFFGECFTSCWIKYPKIRKCEPDQSFDCWIKSQSVCNFSFISPFFFLFSHSQISTINASFFVSGIDFLYLLKAAFNLKKLDGTISHWQQLMELEFTWQERRLLIPGIHMDWQPNNLAYCSSIHLFITLLRSNYSIFPRPLLHFGTFLLFSSPRFFSLWNENASIWSSK